MTWMALLMREMSAMTTEADPAVNVLPCPTKIIETPSRCQEPSFYKSQPHPMTNFSEWRDKTKIFSTLHDLHAKQRSRYSNTMKFLQIWWGSIGSCIKAKWTGLGELVINSRFFQQREEVGEELDQWSTLGDVRCCDLMKALTYHVAGVNKSGSAVSFSVVKVRDCFHRSPMRETAWKSGRSLILLNGKRRFKATETAEYCDESWLGWSQIENSSNQRICREGCGKRFFNGYTS